MNLYIEDAIFDTTAINTVILFITCFSLRQKIIWWKLILIALLGCCFSIVLTLINIQFTIDIIFKLLCGILMSALAVEKFNYKSLLLFFLVFISVTFLIGGFCFFIIYLLGGEIYSLQDATYNLPISLGFLTICIGLYVYFLICLIKIFYKKQKLETFNYKIKVEVNNKNLNLKAYLDSGNLLQEPDSGRPIIVITCKSFLKLFKNKITLIDCVTKCLNKKINGKYIKFNTVSSSGDIFVFDASKIELEKDNKLVKLSNKALIGVSVSQYNFNNFDALLNPLCF